MEDGYVSEVEVTGSVVNMTLELTSRLVGTPSVRDEVAGSSQKGVSVISTTGKPTSV